MSSQSTPCDSGRPQAAEETRQIEELKRDPGKRQRGRRRSASNPTVALNICPRAGRGGGSKKKKRREKQKKNAFRQTADLLSTIIRMRRLTYAAHIARAVCRHRRTPDDEIPLFCLAPYATIDTNDQDISVTVDASKAVPGATQEAWMQGVD